MPISPGPRRLRILLRPIGIETSQVLHDRQVNFSPGLSHEIRVNFLLSNVTINGQREYFTGPADGYDPTRQ